VYSPRTKTRNNCAPSCKQLFQGTVAPNSAGASVESWFPLLARTLPVSAPGRPKEQLTFDCKPHDDGERGLRRGPGSLTMQTIWSTRRGEGIRSPESISFEPLQPRVGSGCDTAVLKNRCFSLLQGETRDPSVPAFDTMLLTRTRSWQQGQTAARVHASNFSYASACIRSTTAACMGLRLVGMKGEPTASNRKYSRHCCHRFFSYNPQDTY
jgi:hypothetical protein